MTRRFLGISFPLAEKSNPSPPPTPRRLFLGDEILSAALLHHLSVIGEAVSRLSAGLRERHPEVPWSQIIAVRNRVVHAYFDLDWQILWVAASVEIPELRRQVLNILATDLPPAEA